MDTIETIEVISDLSARFRYRCPLSALNDLSSHGSHYSSEFGIGGHRWRLHLHQRLDAEDTFLSVHLQSCTHAPVLLQFRLTLVCPDDPPSSKSHTFRCTYSKCGSAWGMNRFLPIGHLLRPGSAFVYVDASTGTRCFDIEVLLKVLESESNIRSSNGINKSHSRRRIGSAPSEALSRVQPPRSVSAGQHAPRAPLMFPFEHLEDLADMTFDVHGARVPAHRCVVAARMRPLLPERMLPLQPGCIVAISVSMDVFAVFLRYVYTEEYPESGVLPPEALLDLYLLSAACEFYDLSGVCLKYVRPILTSENILRIVLTRYNAGDDVLNALYLRVLIDNYDSLIQDPSFENIPGHLFRRLSLIMWEKEPIPQVVVPPAKNTLSRQLAWLAESGEYSDMDLVVGSRRVVIKAHRFILASRCVLFSQTFNPRAGVAHPSFTSAEFDFSQRSWQKLLVGIYRHHLEAFRDFSAEDVAIIFKMHTILGMDGHLKREADEAFNNQNALRLLIYAVKHEVVELHERAIGYVAANFQSLVQNDPQAWELISELPQHAVVALFRTVVESRMKQDGI